MQCELQEQSRKRYSLVGRQLLEGYADVVLLQECEAAFFSASMNSEADKIAQQYHVFACNIDENPGTAVLVKRFGRAKPMCQKPLCVGNEKGTYLSASPYVATTVQLLVGSEPVTVASLHVPFWRFSSEQATQLLKALEYALAGQKHIIVGGDFNAGSTPDNDYLPQLEGNTFFGGLQRAQLAPGTMTGLTGDFSKQVAIDHIYTSSGLGIESACALASPGSGPYSLEGTGPADIVGCGSDHVPVLAHINLQPTP